MNVRNLLTTPIAAALMLLGVALPSRAGAAEQGTLVNHTNRTIVYQAGYVVAPGRINWQTYSLVPGQYHTWTVQDPRNNPLHIQYEMSPGRMQHGGLFTRPNGFVSAFFMVGNLVIVDASGGAKINPPSIAPPAVAPMQFAPAIAPPGY